MTPSHETDISHTDLRGTHGGLTETGASRVEEVRALRAYLEGEGDPWMGSESLAGSVYRAVTRQALEVYESLAERHVTTGGDVEFMASNYLSAEQRSEEAADRITRAVQRP